MKIPGKYQRVHTEIPNWYTTLDNTFICTYLSTLSTKDFAKINKLTMVVPFAGSYGMTILFLAPPAATSL
jgi:hypothetical protein